MFIFCEFLTGDELVMREQFSLLVLLVVLPKIIYWLHFLKKEYQVFPCDVILDVVKIGKSGLLLTISRGMRLMSHT
jgi:hypothetical protein